MKVVPTGISRDKAAFGLAFTVTVWQLGALTLTFIADGVVHVTVWAVVVGWSRSGRLVSHHPPSPNC